MAKSLLMCPPDFFGIEYEINPWMNLGNPASPDLARRQWQALYDLYTGALGWQVQLIEPQTSLPDMVFTANGALVIEERVALPRFRQPEREPETQHFAAWFRARGYQVLFQPRHDFEGEGDALLWNDILFAGYPWRSDKPAHQELADFFGLQVVSLQLTDARFYHLDTAFTPLDGDTVAIYPPAFTEESLAQIHRYVPRVVEASDADALGYGLNAISDGRRVVMSDRADGLAARYRQLGLAVHPVDISEFQKAGGGVKCLSLELRR